MTDDELLDHLVGTWRVTGEMRGTALRQSANGRRVLAGRFIELRISDGEPAIGGRPYEAIYLIGRQDDGRFVMLLADVFGATSAATPGIGRRDGDDLIFEFDYPGERWTWRWSPAGDGWGIEQTYVKDGERRAFATKRMDRVAP